MSRISNELANQIAIKLTEKSRQSVEKLHVDFREAVTLAYENTIPQEIQECLKKYPDWITTRSSIRLNGHGFNWEHVTATRQVPANSSENTILNFTSKVSDKLMAAKRKWEKAKKQHEDLKSETKQALLALKTFNNIRKEFPEAAPMLPPPMSNALVVDFDSLKRRLEKQNQGEGVERSVASKVQ